MDKKLINSNLRKSWIFYLSLFEDYNPGGSCSKSSENCSKEVKAEANICVILTKRYMKSRTYLSRRLLLFIRIDILVNGFHAFRSIRKCKKLGS